MNLDKSWHAISMILVWSTILYSWIGKDELE